MSLTLLMVCVAAAFKYRNNTGTLFIPTDQAFSLLANRTGLNVLTPNAITTSLLQALLEYHFIFEVLDVSASIPCMRVAMVWSVCAQTVRL